MQSEKADLGEKLDTSPSTTDAPEKPATSEAGKESEGQIELISTELCPNDETGNLKEEEIQDFSSTKDIATEAEAREGESIIKDDENNLKGQLKATTTELDPNEVTADIKDVDIQTISPSTKDTTLDSKACEDENIVKEKENDQEQKVKTTFTKLDPNEVIGDLIELDIPEVCHSMKDCTVKSGACEDEENDPKEQRKSTTTELDTNEATADIKVEIHYISPSRKDTTIESKARKGENIIKDIEDTEEPIKAIATEIDPNEVIADLKQLETQEISSSTKVIVVEAEACKYKENDPEEQMKATSTELNPNEETADLKKLELQDVSLSTKDTTVEAEACEGKKIVKGKENEEEKAKATSTESEPNKEVKDLKKEETQKAETESLSEDVSHVDVQKPGTSQQNLTEEMKGCAESATTIEDSLATMEKSHYENQENLIEELKRIMAHVEEIAKRENINLD